MPTERSIVLFQKKELCLLYSSCLFGSDLSIALSLTVLQILTDFRQTSTCGDQLTNDDVLLQAGQRVDLALDGSFGQHAGGLLEGCSGQEGVVCQSSLGDAQQHLLVRCV